MVHTGNVHFTLSRLNKLITSFGSYLGLSTISYLNCNVDIWNMKALMLLWACNGSDQNLLSYQRHDKTIDCNCMCESAMHERVKRYSLCVASISMM